MMMPRVMISKRRKREGTVRRLRTHVFGPTGAGAFRPQRAQEGALFTGAADKAKVTSARRVCKQLLLSKNFYWSEALRRQPKAQP